MSTVSLSALRAGKSRSLSVGLSVWTFFIEKMFEISGQVFMKPARTQLFGWEELTPNGQATNLKLWYPAFPVTYSETVALEALSW
jgi:hypothetical protein